MSNRTAAPDVKAQLAMIEREAQRRGLVLEHRGEIVTDIEGEPAPEGERFCQVARAAWAATDGLTEVVRARPAHVGQIVGAVAKTAVDRSGPVRVSRTAWVLLKSYARTGKPPEREAGPVSAPSPAPVARKARRR